MTEMSVATRLDDEERATLAAIADYFIPEEDSMPSAAEVLNDDRLTFVIRARPDLAEPLKAALRPDLGPDVRDRLATLAGEPTNLSALQLTIVGGYYTDRRVRELIGYPGQVAIELRSPDSRSLSGRLKTISAMTSDSSIGDVLEKVSCGRRAVP